MSGGVTGDRPAAETVKVSTPADGAVPTMWLALFGLLLVSLVGMGRVLVGRRAKRAAVLPVTAPAMTFAEAQDAAIEAELQAIIIETKTRVADAPDDLETAGDERELSTPR